MESDYKFVSNNTDFDKEKKTATHQPTPSINEKEYLNSVNYTLILLEYKEAY